MLPWVPPVDEMVSYIKGDKEIPIEGQLIRMSEIGVDNSLPSGNTSTMVAHNIINTDGVIVVGETCLLLKNLTEITML
jgi:hypothetical protein